MNVKFYNLAKKVNSTKQPAVSDPFDSVDVVLKTPSSILAPVVELNMPSVPAWNYAYIPDMERYYYVTGTAYNRGVWEISLSVDVMASFKSDIGGTSMYMLRSSTSQTGTLIDSLYPATNACSHQLVTVKSSTTFAGGTIALNVANGDSNSGLTTYVMNVQNFGNFLDAIMINGDTDSASWDSQNQSIEVTKYEPARYIYSAYWFPGSYSHYNDGAALSTMKLGNFTATGFTFYKANLSASALTLTYNITLPKHPQAAARGSFCNGEPYSEYVLNMGPFGGVALPAVAMANATSITAKVYEDILTGQGRLMVYTAGGILLANVTTQWGVPLPIFSGGYRDYSGKATRNAGLLSAAIGTAELVGAGAAGWNGNGESAAGLAVSGGATVVSGMETAIRGANAINKGAITSIGSAGGFMDHLVVWDLDATFYDIASDNNANNGRPYCRTSTPATLGGYMIAQKGLVTSNAATRTELDSINAYMVGGFYYE